MSKSVLLVDDEAIVRIGVRSCVNWNKLRIDQVFESSNGAEALEVMKKQDIDIVITDLNMSVMDGFSMMKAVLSGTGHVPKFIIMSCYNDYENMRRAIQYGVSDFLFKPKMFPEDIEKAIQNVLESDGTGGSDRVSESDGTGGSDMIPDKAPEKKILQEKLTADNYQDHYAALIESIRQQTESPQQIIDAITEFTIQLMNLDTSEPMHLHAFGIQLFQKIVELKKCRTLEQCLAILSEMDLFERSTLREKLNEALEFIEKHLTDVNLSQELVADHVGLSTSYFCRLFKNEMNIGYASYIIKKRIDLANFYLSTTTMKTSEISKAVGYTNDQYFSRLYKQYTGRSMKPGKR